MPAMSSAPKAMLSGIAVFFLSTLLLSPFSFAQTSQVTTYDELLSAIRLAHHASEGRIEQAVEQEKVREAWETGKLIDEHILLNKERADYGEQVIKRLADDLGGSHTELKYMLQFFRTYPIGPPADQLSWAHYRELLSINDSEEREEVTKEAVEKKWNRDQIREEIRKRNTSSASPKNSAGDLKLPDAKPGKVSVYKVVEKNGKEYYDLGFNTYRRLLGAEPAKFKAGNHVFIKPAGPSYQPVAVKANPADLYTYNARAGEVVDGDTFHADIDLGFGIVVNRRVRFLKIDAPEIESAEGKKAKAHLEKLLTAGKNLVVLKTSGEDQHGRPLVQAWVCVPRSVKASGHGTRTTGDECKSLEQSLLDEGLAVSIQG